MELRDAIPLMLCALTGMAFALAALGFAGVFSGVLRADFFVDSDEGLVIGLVGIATCVACAVALNSL